MKKHVVEELRRLGLTTSAAEFSFRYTCAAIEAVLAAGKPVKLPGVGTLMRRHRAETKRRNPQSGEAITIGGHDVVALRNARKF